MNSDGIFDCGVMNNVQRVTRVVKVVAQKYFKLYRFPTLEEMDYEFRNMKLSQKERWDVWLETCQEMWYIAYRINYSRQYAYSIGGYDPWEGNHWIHNENNKKKHGL